MYKKCICCVYHVHLSLYSVGRQNKFYEKKNMKTTKLIAVENGESRLICVLPRL